MNKLQLKALRELEPFIGKRVHIATSEYSMIDKTDRWNPVTLINASTLRSLEKKGHIKASFFWRGATIFVNDTTRN